MLTPEQNAQLMKLALACSATSYDRAVAVLTVPFRDEARKEARDADDQARKMLLAQLNALTDWSTARVDQ